LAMELETQPGPHQGADPRIDHVQAIENGGLVETGVELKVGEILFGENPAVILVLRAGGDQTRDTWSALPLRVLFPSWRNPNRWMAGEFKIDAVADRGGQ